MATEGTAADRLAALIRRADGDHSLGAGALAEKLVELGVYVSEPSSLLGRIQAAPEQDPAVLQARIADLEADNEALVRELQGYADDLRARSREAAGARGPRPWEPYLDTNNLFVSGEIFPSGIVVSAYLERDGAPEDAERERRYLGTRVYSYNAPGQEKAADDGR